MESTVAEFSPSCEVRLGSRQLTVACLALLVWILVAQVASAQTFTVLATFNGTNGSIPDAPLVQGFDGNLYGVTAGGGTCPADSRGCGVVFRITPQGLITKLYNFCSPGTLCSDGRYPNSLMLATDGNFYGTTGGGANGNGTIFRITPTGSLTTLYRFGGRTNPPNGGPPSSSLVQAIDGNFYGTTINGGGLNCGTQSGCGTVYKITPSGTLTTLYRFCSKTNCSDGAFPVGGLVQASNGKLYGVTAGGGVVNNLCATGALPPSCGTMFEITASGSLTTLHDFCTQSSCSDGAFPVALVQGKGGYFYGTASEGGLTNSLCYPMGCGTVFKVTTTGTLTTLYSFCSKTNCTDGANPEPVIQATDGKLYGPTVDGSGASFCANGFHYCGTLFQITSSGTLTTLHRFCSQFSQGVCADGTYSGAGLTQATNGNFYGAASQKVFSLSVGLGPFVETLPTSGKVGSTVNILGTNLTGATGVKFNGTAASFTVISGTRIQAFVPTGSTAGYVTVTTPSVTLKSNFAFQILP